jgi:SAM-dependent methyltransferase
MTMPLIFDRALLRARRARAEVSAVPGADFLLARAASDLEDRLAAILRTFPVALDLATPGRVAADVLAASGKAELIVRLDPLVRAGGPYPAITGDAEALPITPASLDLVVSLLALQTANDLPGALVQARRALKPDGLFLAALLGGRTLMELREAFAVAESEVEGGVSPRVAPFADLRDMGGLLQRAGFALPVTDVDTVVVRYADPFALFRDLRAMGATNPLTERRRTPLRRATLLRAVQVYVECFADPDGRVRATFEIVWVSGWAPHDSQQKPLRPGSAKARLADALNVPEGRLPRG